MTDTSRGAIISKIFIAMAIMVVLVALQLFNDRVIILDAANFDDTPSDQNTEKVCERRKAFSAELRCDEKPTHNMTIRSEWFIPPDPAGIAKGAVAAPVQPCTYSFLDIGVGGGESMGWFIDAGIPVCPAGKEGMGSKISHYNVEQGSIMTQVSTMPTPLNMKPNVVTAWAYNAMLSAGMQTMVRALQPEEYCYYGVEENPVYTNVLQKLSTVVLRSRPRPLRQVHFYTGTPVVGAITDKTTKSSKLRIGSSSINYITLSLLLADTVRPQAGNHVMVRVHGDNAYSIVNNAFDDGTLCGLAEQAVRLDVLIQATHSSSKDADYERFRDIVKGELHFCGVHVRAVNDVP
jgi:hypothetical protein